GRGRSGRTRRCAGFSLGPRPESRKHDTCAWRPPRRGIVSERIGTVARRSGVLSSGSFARGIMRAFITFEGIEGSGKTTQIQLLSERLDRGGIEHVLTREPGGTEVGNQLRRLLLSPVYSDLTPLAELLLYQAARAQHLARVIIPSLAEGKVVLCDRYKDATR